MWYLGPSKGKQAKASNPMIKDVHFAVMHNLKIRSDAVSNIVTQKIDFRPKKLHMEQEKMVAFQMINHTIGFNP